MKKSVYTFIKDDRKDPGAQILKALLWLLSLLYALIVKLRLALFKAGLLKPVIVPKPVISVGNITTGGVGKTPFVAYLAEHLQRKGKKPVILLRGYMDKKDASSDEAQWYQQHLKNVPVLVGENRAFEAQKFLHNGSADIFLMDDGFQHLRLKRDLDIVLIDATQPWGGGRLLPRGFLREPLLSLSRADIFLVTRTDQAADALETIDKKLTQLNARALIAHSVHQPVKVYEARSLQEFPLSELKGMKAVASCSIACPHAFEQSLRQLKMNIIASFAFMDHHVYSSDDIKKIVRAAQESGAQAILTTEKDLVKLKDFFKELPEGMKLMALRIEMAVTKNEHELLKRIDHLLQR